MKKIIKINTVFPLVLFLSLFLANICPLCSQNLPSLSLDLAEFKGEVKGNSIYLFWEWNNSADEEEYVIERAGADANFTEIGTAGMNYDFEDLNPHEVVNYYRLAAMNSDGQKAYSDVIAVEYEISKQLRISPNPASSFIEVGFFLAKNSSASILIMNQQGVLVEQQEVETMFESAQQLRIDLQDYAPGVYLIRIDQGSFARTRKFVVL